MKTDYVPINTLRLKVTDKCPGSCWFCHNEGTGIRDPSLFRDVQWDEKLQTIIEKLKQTLPIQEVHLTGGEPTTNPNLPDLIRGISMLGFKVKVTTIGCSHLTLNSLAEAGLKFINFTLLAVNPEQFWHTQTRCSKHTAEKLLLREMDSILLA